MSIRTPLGFAAALAALTGALAPSARASDPFPFKYALTNGSAFAPVDVAVWAPVGVSPQYVLVADQATNKIMRFTLLNDGTPLAGPPVTWSFEPGYILRALAVNDDPSSPNYLQVYAAGTAPFGGGAIIDTFDLNGVMINNAVSTTGFNDITALALDREGDLYVADAGAQKTMRFPAAPFLQWNVSLLLTPTATFFPFTGAPADVTVTDDDLVLVADDTGHLMASDRLGGDWFNRNLGVPALQRTSIDAHCESCRLWSVGSQSPMPVTLSAERRFFPDCYAGNGASNVVDGTTLTGGGGTLNNPARVEYARFWDQPLGKPRCTERVFVADPAGHRVACYARSQTVLWTIANPAAFWRFDETGSSVFDSSGNGNTGLMGWSTYPRREEGMVSRGLVFDDTNDGVSVASSPSLNLGTGSYTIDCWVRTCDTRGVRDILDKRLLSGGSALKGYALYLYNGYLSFQIAANNTWWNIGTNAYPAGFAADGKFHHLAVVVDRDANSANQDTIAFWVDGQQVGPNVGIPSSVLGNVSNNVDLLIGRHPTYGDSGGLKGEIDEIAIYKRALTPSRIIALHNAEGAGRP